MWPQQVQSHSGKSHKEGPTAGGRIPYELASGKNALRSQAQRRNLIRRDPPQVGGCLMSLRPEKIPYGARLSEEIS